MGKSPFRTLQFTIVVSPEFMASSPKSNEEICGGTKAIFQINEILHLYISKEFLKIYYYWYSDNS